MASHNIARQPTPNRAGYLPNALSRVCDLLAMQYQKITYSQEGNR